MILLQKGRVPRLTFACEAAEPVEMTVELLTPSGLWHHTPDTLLASKSLRVDAGVQTVPVDFGVESDVPRYGFVRFPACPGVTLHTSTLRVTGLLALRDRATAWGAPAAVFAWRCYAPAKNR